MATITDKILASRDRDAARLDTYLPGTRRVCALILPDGQSQSSGGGSDNADPIAFGPRDGFGTNQDQTESALMRLVPTASGSGGQDRHGASTFAYGFARQMVDSFDVVVVSAMSAWQGTRFLPDTPNAADWSFSVKDEDVADSMVRSSAARGVQVRNQIVAHALNAIRLRPDLKLEYRIVLWAHGTADAPHIGSEITQQGYADGLQEYWTWRRDVEGFDVMAIFQHGFVGTTPEIIAANEPGNSSIRAAQDTLVSSNSDVVWASQAPTSPGPLTTDANGVWVDGFEVAADGVHWTGEAQNAHGRFAAIAVASHLGLPLAGYGNIHGYQYGGPSL